MDNDILNEALSQMREYPTNLVILYEWLKNRKFPVRKQEHPMYRSAKKELDAAEVDDSDSLLKDALERLLNMTGPEQLIVKHDKGDISIIRGGCSFGQFEIFCPALFEDIERYPDVKSCGLRIVELMTLSETRSDQ
ncbi:MAG TPA: hypothetical protein ENH82_07245 [bacterium]|nr:hypothetical protein [bacterium]